MFTYDSYVPITEHINYNETLKVAMSFKFIMTTTGTSSYFTKQQQNCLPKTKMKTAVCN